MTTSVNKLKGTLRLGPTGTGGISCEAQVSHIGTPQAVTRDSPLTVLTGDVVQAAATYSWQLTGQMILDYNDPAGVFYWARANQGTTQQFTFVPSTPGPTISGVCIVDGWNTEELAAGAIVTSKFAWPIQGQITVAPPVAATGATAGTPGTFTPAGAVPPATVAAMTGVTASPTTAWTAGQYVQTQTPGTAGQAHWTGTAWTSGTAFAADDAAA